MMDVRIVLMAVGHGNVVVRVRVGLAAVPGEVVLVAVVLVVGVRMLVCERLVAVRVAMALEDMQRDTARDERRGDPESRIRRLVEQGKRRGRADERRGREIGAGSRRTEQ